MMGKRAFIVSVSAGDANTATITIERGIEKSKCKSGRIGRVKCVRKAIWKHA